MSPNLLGGEAVLIDFQLDKVLPRTGGTRAQSAPYDIWMLEGFDQTPQKTWLDRLLRR